MIFRSEDKFSLVIFQVKYLGKAVDAHFISMPDGTSRFRTAEFLAECDSPPLQMERRNVQMKAVLVCAVHAPVGARPAALNSGLVWLSGPCQVTRGELQSVICKMGRETNSEL